MTPSVDSRWLPRAVLAMAAVLFLAWLGGHDLWAPDEPYFAEGAREMVVDGQWAVPHVNGVVTTDKPPFFFWMIALFSLPWGTVTELTARLPSALAALGTLALTMRLGERGYGARAGALAGAVLATTYMFWEKARWCETDALLCFFIWVALSAFAAHRAGEADGRRAGLLFWLAASLAVLTKGPVGLLLPLGIALVTLALDRRLGDWRRFAPFAGPALFAVVIGAWMVLATVGGGGEYSVWGALKKHFLERGLYGLHHKRPPWYFLGVLPPNLLPWTALVPGALVLAWRRRRAADRLALAAALFVVVFFSISTEKRELYALPALPAFALMIAALVAATCGWEAKAGPGEGETRAPDRRWVSVGQGIVGGLLALVGVALPVAAGRTGREVAELIAPGVLWAAGGLLVAVGLLTVIQARRGRLLAASLTPAAGFALIYLLVAVVVYPAMEPRKSARALAGELVRVSAASRAQGVPVVAYAMGNVPKALAFYSDGVYTVETEDAAELARYLDRPEEVVALVNADELARADPALLARLHVVEETELSRRRVILATHRGGAGAGPPSAAPPPGG